MSDVGTLLSRCRELGAEFIQTSNGVKVRAPAPLPEEMRQELKLRKAEILSFLATCFCGTTENTWTVNRGTCWARIICWQCQGKVTMPTRHNCDPALPLTAPCVGQSETEGWTCRKCSQPVEIEDIIPALSGQQTLTIWKCRTCLIWGATSDTLRQPPAWVPRTMQ